VTITDRGRPVARLVPTRSRQPFPDLKKIRLKARAITLRLSEALLNDREGRG